MTNIQYSRVDIHTLPALWERVLPLVKSYLRNSIVTTPKDLAAQLMTQQKVLWLCHSVDNPTELHNIVVTEFVKYDTGLFLCVQGCATFPDKILDLDFLHTFFTGYAKSANCLGYEIVGRQGWARRLPELQSEGVVLRATFKQ